MSKRSALTIRRLLIVTASLLGAGVAGGSPGSAATALRFTLDRPIDGATAPFAAAATKGLFAAEGLNVTIVPAAGSQDAIARVASGDSDIALADINVLIRYRDGDKAAPLKAVFVLHNKAPYALIARRSRGIDTMSQIEGKALGLVEGDPTARLWPSVAKRNGIARNKMRVDKISAAVREPLLSAGQVDAVSGFSYLSAVNLRDRGVPASDLAVLQFADFGSQAYGHALIVNPKFAAENPDAIKAFVRATIAGVRYAVKNPARAIDDVLAQMNGGSRELELERLHSVIHDNILTDDVKHHGIGAIDATRFDAALGEIAEDFKFRNPRALADIFDDGYLPPEGARKIN